jgi:hypothetical protein
MHKVTGPPTSRRRKSEPRFALAQMRLRSAKKKQNEIIEIDSDEHSDTNTQKRLRSAKNKPNETIEIDSDEHSDKLPPVSFYYKLFHNYESNYLQSKRAKVDLRTLTPPPVESDGNGAPKVVHGSAVEPSHVPLPAGSEHGMRKEFIWTTVSNH